MNGGMKSAGVAAGGSCTSPPQYGEVVGCAGWHSLQLVELLLDVPLLPDCPGGSAAGVLCVHGWRPSRRSAVVVLEFSVAPRGAGRSNVLLWLGPCSILPIAFVSFHPCG